jgi:signal peptidase I
MDIQAIKGAINKQPLALLLCTLALFLIANWLLRDNPSLSFVPILIALLVVVEIFVFVGMEVKEGAEKHGWKHEALDTLIALVVAVAAWYCASFILNTSSPISAVVSCSMLPNLQRGDFVIVQGAPVRAYDISMSPEELASLTDRATVFYNGTNTSIDGSLFAYCLSYNASVCSAFKHSPESIVEQKGAFTYRYEACPISFSSGQNFYEPCVRSVTFHGQEFLTNFSNDVIVYQPPKSDVYASIGDIVHRAMFRINVDGSYYYLTRGDNNPILDIQVYDYANGASNHPVPAQNARGKMVVRVPLLGYFKLFISGFLQEDPQCKTQLTFDHAQ